VIFPNDIKAGLSFKAQVLSLVYQAPMWTVTALLRGAGAYTLTAVSEGANHVFLIGADVTKDWLAGDYAYAIRASNSVDVVEIESGFLTIQADLTALSAGHDSRDHLRKVIDAIEATIEKRATTSQQRYTIETGATSREIWQVPIAELLLLRDRYKAELRRMNAQKKGGLFNTAVKVRFSRV
jgi:hypothetical protein